MTGVYVQAGNNWNYENPTEEVIKAGTVVIIGETCGIAATDIEPHAVGVVSTTGVWAFKKAAGVITAGAKVYYDDGADNATTTEKDHLLGIAVAEAKDADATVMVKINAAAKTAASEAA